MTSTNDAHKIAYLANIANGEALYAHAMAFGASESSVESQHIKAIAVLTALQSGGASSPYLTDALALLSAKLTFLRDPAHGIDTRPDRAHP